MIAVFDTNIVIDSLNGAVLVTRNTKDFKPDWDGIRLPYTI